MEPAASFERFDELLAHRDWVRRVARALVGDDATADDLEQDVWLLAARAERPRSPRAWLGTVLRHSASNLRTSARRRERHEAAAPQPRGVPSPSEMIERAEIVERVARAVRTLDEPYRTVVFLRYFEDLAPPEIAARLSEPLETVRTRLRRALAQLRERLDAEHGGDRRAWCLLLVPVARTPRAASSAPLAPAAALGAIAMTLTTKIVLATAAVLLVAGVAWWARSGGDVARPASRVTPPPDAPAVAAAAPRTRQRATPPAADASPSTDARPTSPAGEVAVGRVVDDATGAAVAGATVRLVYGLHARDLAAAPRGVSGEDGRFRIEGIGANEVQRHELYVEAAGHADGYSSVYGWHDRARAGEPTDLGEVRLERGAKVEGRVLAADGTPLPGALVLFCRETRTSSPPTFQPNDSREVATTDADGRFALEHVPSAAGDFQHTLFALTADAFGWLTLPRVTGKKDLTDVEVRIVPTAALDVTVRAADGAPVAGARVAAIPHFPPLGTLREWPAVHELWIERPALKAIFEGTTDGAGAVRLARLPVDGAACAYDVAVRARGFGLGAKDGVRVAPGSTASVAIEVAPFRTIAVTGTVRTADGVPLAGAEADFCGKKVRTDASGAFRVEGIDPARYDSGAWLVVGAPGYAKEERNFKLPATGDLGPMDFVLAKAVALRIRVVDAAGAPVRGVQVTLRNEQQSIESLVTDDDGRATLGAAPGTGVVSFHPPEPSLDWQIPDDVPVPAADADVAVVLRKVPSSARVVAEVVDDATGKPIDPTDAMLSPVDWKKVPRVSWLAPALEGGRVVAERAFPGDWLLWVAAEGRAPARAAFHVEEGQREARVVVRCAAPGTVRGVVDGYVRPDGRRGMLFLSLPDVQSKPQWVRLQSDPALIDAAWIADDGTFRIEGVPPGRLRIWTELEGRRVDEVVDVQPGAVTDVVLRPVAAGRATFRAAEAAAVFVVRFRGADGLWTNWTAVSPRGEQPAVWTTNTPLGRVTWEARRGRGKKWPAEDAAPDASGEFDAKAGETVEVTIPAR